MRKSMWVVAGILFLLLAVGGYVLQSVRSLDVEQISDDVFAIRGLGGNVGVLRTGAGAVVVDTMTLPMQGERIRERAEEITGEPVALVINTHYHADHTHGNPGFESGTRVVSTRATLHHMKTLDGEYWQGEAAQHLPNETFERAEEIELGDKTVRVLYLGDGHTDGDLVVWFVEDRVVHMGDLFFNRHYPRIDLEGAAVPRSGETRSSRCLDSTSIASSRGTVPPRTGRGCDSSSASFASLRRWASRRRGWSSSAPFARRR